MERESIIIIQNCQKFRHFAIRQGVLLGHRNNSIFSSLTFTNSAALQPKISVMIILTCKMTSTSVMNIALFFRLHNSARSFEKSAP